MTDASTVVIINPTAGRGRAGKEVANIRRLLGAAASDWDWRFTQAQGDAERMAREAARARAQRVVAVGGDGTAYETANGLLGSETVLGLIPFGTGNDLARTLGLFNDLPLACRTLIDGVVRRLDVGVMEGQGTDGARLFLVVAGTGYVADTAKTVNDGVKFLSGPAAYVYGAVTTLKDFTPFQMTLETDRGDRFEGRAMFAAVANTPVTGGGMRLTPDADVFDGVLDICVVAEVSKPQLLNQLTKVFAGNHVHHPAVTIWKATRVTIQTDPPQLLWADGDTLGATPVTFSIRPAALPIQVPA